jgi:hypothetical protein
MDQQHLGPFFPPVHNLIDGLEAFAALPRALTALEDSGRGPQHTPPRRTGRRAALRSCRFQAAERRRVNL